VLLYSDEKLKVGKVSRLTCTWKKTQKEGDFFWKKKITENGCSENAPYEDVI
jgi:hypothetical protein